MTTRSGALAALAAVALFAGPANADEQLDRGKYLATIMDCAGCHTPWKQDGTPDFAKALQGANYGFEMPGLGVFVPPNLTSDKTGLGDLSDAEVIAAVTTGVRPDGRMLAPIMPWHSYGALTPDDAKALVAYLRTLPHAAYDAPGPFGPGETVPVPYLTMKMPG